jgi:hypothetical protein
MEPRFTEMNKVRVSGRRFGEVEGYVIASQFRDGRWIYKVSVTENPKKGETFDNWFPEEWLEPTKYRLWSFYFGIKTMSPKNLKLLIAGLALLIFGPVTGWVLMCRQHGLVKYRSQRD